MTNREYIESLTNEKIADFLSGNTDCEACPIKDYCYKYSGFFGVCYRVWLRWLEDEHKEEEE